MHETSTNRSPYITCHSGVGCLFASRRDFFRYKMLGLRSLVSNEDTGQQFEAGFTAASYKAREAGLSGCAAQAATAAAARRLKNWSYICCTVTEKSQCATTVR